MKRLFYLSASILMLALAFHFGYTTARLPRALLWPFGPWAVVTASGDVTTVDLPPRNRAV